MARMTFNDGRQMLPLDALPRTGSLTERLARRFFDKNQTPSASSGSALSPRPTQLTLPLGEHGPGSADAPSLFREARRVEAVLSYEQARIDEVIPDMRPPAGASTDRLVLPGGTGLILYDGPRTSLSFDWMQWGEKADTASMRPAVDATVSVTDLIKGSRTTRKLARRRCVIPLTRYSVPVRDGDIWSHLWVSPMQGQVACAAGIWITGQDKLPRFVMVTGGPGLDPSGPLLLPEDDLLVWLRAPLKEALSRIARHLATRA